ncbi:hypothetical protein BDQ17DRAFT_1435651 [Cyathus striatus]|nr:hypothetical protein BDQ17DRAFT_1435651 [Cyathus striatus]
MDPSLNVGIDHNAMALISQLIQQQFAQVCSGLEQEFQNRDRQMQEEFQLAVECLSTSNTNLGVCTHDNPSEREAARVPVQQTSGATRLLSPSGSANQPPLYQVPAVSVSLSHANPLPSTRFPKKRMKPYQLSKYDKWEDDKGLKDSILIHIHYLWGLPDPSSIPYDPPADVLDSFSRRFSSPEEVNNHGTEPLIQPSEVTVQPWKYPLKKGRSIAFIHCFEDTVVGLIRATMARYGLPIWCPDLHQLATSTYNTAHKIVAVETYRQALIMCAYDSYGVEQKWSSRMDVLYQVYNHYVHHSFCVQYDMEARSPGILWETDELSAVRRKFIDDNGYPERYKLLLSPKATSDDECDPANSFVGRRPVFYIKKHPERSKDAEAFIQQLDQQWELVLESAPNHHVSE